MPLAAGRVIYRKGKRLDNMRPRNRAHEIMRIIEAGGYLQNASRSSL